ncbi:zinc finger protein 185-like isoform X2 [Arapaima gigas]
MRSGSTSNLSATCRVPCGIRPNPKLGSPRKRGVDCSAQQLSSKLGRKAVQGHLLSEQYRSSPESSRLTHTEGSADNVERGRQRGDNSWIKHRRNLECSTSQECQFSLKNEPNPSASPSASPGIASSSQSAIFRTPDLRAPFSPTTTGGFRVATDDNESTSAESAKAAPRPSVSPQEATFESTPLKSVKSNTNTEGAPSQTETDITNMMSTSTGPEPTDEASAADDSGKDAAAPTDVNITTPEPEAPEETPQSSPIQDVSAPEDNSSPSLNIPKDITPESKEPQPPTLQRECAHLCTCSVKANTDDDGTHLISSASIPEDPEPTRQISVLITDSAKGVLTEISEDTSNQEDTSHPSRGTGEDKVPELTSEEGSAKPELLNEESPPENETDTSPFASMPKTPELTPQTSSTHTNAGQEMASVITPTTASTEKSMENSDAKVQDLPRFGSRPEEPSQVPEEKPMTLEHEVHEPGSVEKSSEELLTQDVSSIR